MRINEGGTLTADFSFSQEEQEKIIYKLWELLKIQAHKYNGIDSTSMTIEKAQDILESMLYTIGMAMKNGTTKEEILRGDLSCVIERGRAVLKEKQKAIKVEWKLLCQDLPRIKNVYYLTTIKSLGDFFERYDIYYQAHDIPCDIDYWPLCPISEDIKGISFIEEYIHRLQMESDFLNYFEMDDLTGLYKAYVPDYADCLFNLCEPVLTNALGLAIAGEDIRNVNISEECRERIFQILDGKTADEIQSVIGQAVLFVCRKTGLTEKREVDYFAEAAAEIAVRVSHVSR